jgi:hypothetical protein
MKILKSLLIFLTIAIWVSCTSDDPDPVNTIKNNLECYPDSLELEGKYPKKLIWLQDGGINDTVVVFNFIYSNNRVKAIPGPNNLTLTNLEFQIRNDSSPEYWVEFTDTTFVTIDGELCRIENDSNSCFHKWTYQNGKTISYRYNTDVEQLIWDNNFENIVEKRQIGGTFDGWRELYTYYSSPSTEIGNFALMRSNFMSNIFRTYSGFNCFMSKNLLKTMTQIDSNGDTIHTSLEYCYDKELDMLQIKNVDTPKIRENTYLIFF